MSIRWCMLVASVLLTSACGDDVEPSTPDAGTRTDSGMAADSAMHDARAVPPPAVGCTDGTDCTCDRLTTAHGDRILHCEDFEDAAWYENVPGHWVDADPAAGSNDGERGQLSLWRVRYGTSSAYWSEGEPAADVRIGERCVVAGGMGCNGTKEYCGTAQGNVVDGMGADCWQANDLNPPIDIVRDPSEFNEELERMGVPTFGERVGVPVDSTVMGRRVQPGGSSGIVGALSLPDPVDLGITMLVAYSDNFPDSGIMGAPLKHNEWGANNASALLLFSSSPAGGETFPFQGFITPEDGCGALVDGITVGSETGMQLGHTFCDTRFRWRAEPSEYQQSSDWPFGQWRCVRARYTGLDTDNACVTQWISDGAEERVVIDFCGLNGTALVTRNGVAAMSWNAYANANQGDSPTTEVVRRWEDNLVITSGEPVSCAELGFSLGD